MRSRRALVAAVVATAFVAALASMWIVQRERMRADDRLAARLATVTAPHGQRRPCPWEPGERAAKSWLLLVLGQSNAANHGAEEVPLQAGQLNVIVSDGAHCWLTGDPLPGGTGNHQSIWSRLAPALQAKGESREVVLVNLSVDSTTIDDWVRPGSPLAERLVELARRLQGRRPDFVLWQQGESDARAGTSEADYVRDFATLTRHLRREGIAAPILVALSTRCRSAHRDAVRRAQRDVAQRVPGVLPGPDTDLLDGALRNQDCHFSRRGLDAAARLWAEHLLAAAS